jgi:transposase
VRRGKQKAAIAVGHRILLLAYHLLRQREDYQELAPTNLEARRRTHLQNKALRQLRQLGFEVTLTPKEDAA